MENEVTKKEKFEKAAMKAFQSGKYDYFGIAEDNTRATIENSEVSKLKNAFVLIKTAEKVQQWAVENYQVTQCPNTLYVCIKNLKVLLGCLGDKDREESYFEFKNIKEMSTPALTIFGAVEVAECACVFYFDGKSKESCYVSQPSYGDEGADIYRLVNKLRKMEVVKDENERNFVGGLESTGETSENMLWLNQR